MVTCFVWRIVRGSLNIHVYDVSHFIYIIWYHIISLHGVVTLLDVCRRDGVHYRLLSTCVGCIACPGIDHVDTQGQQFLVSSDRPSLNSQHCMCPGQDRTKIRALAEWTYTWQVKLPISHQPRRSIKLNYIPAIDLAPGVDILIFQQIAF
jgi:hypothetical protein